ncbi:MAG: hypothetical protein HKO53_13610, partial [Gemmatimonadetes bacterium]|nr:hypothetical protein [Gemmatimonadota bacterium]
MILKRPILDQIRGGSVSLVFRRWKRPSIRPGGTLHTSVGVLAIDEVQPVDPNSITHEEASAAGHAGRDQLLRALSKRSEGQVYRIRVRFEGEDPRIALRQQIPTGDELRELLRTLERRGGDPSPKEMLQLIRDRPETLAATLAEHVGLDRAVFKRRVRGLKALGLTESLRRGYRL